MSDFAISVPGGQTVRLLTGGKYCPADILVTAEGQAAAPVESDVNFYDYDGTLLYAYTLDEIQELAGLPPLPEHDGLVCQGWNWTLEDLQAYGMPNDIMPYYVTEDGATWYDLVNDTGRDMAVTFRWKQYNTQAVLDFGDGSDTYSAPTVTSGAVISCTHTYAPGSYRAMLSGAYNLGDQSAVADITSTSSALLRRVFLGSSPGYFYTYVFQNCTNLQSVTLTKALQLVGGAQFNGCRMLRALIVPVSSALQTSYVNNCTSLRVLSFANGITGINGSNMPTALRRLCYPETVIAYNSAVAYGYACDHVHIPSGIKSLPANAFLQYNSLKRLVIPAAVTSIGAQAFHTCSSLCVLRFEGETPPTVANANAFTGIPAACIVEVPAGTLATYQAATNYASIAAQMVEV